MVSENLSIGKSILHDVTLSFNSDEIQEYLEVVGDGSQLHTSHQLVPPTFLAARALRELITSLSLPPGSTHIAQDIESLFPSFATEQLTLDAKVDQNTIRGSWRFLKINFQIDNLQGNAVLIGNSTVLIPLKPAGGNN